MAQSTAPPTLIFDLDGTLSDNYVGIASCIRHALARLDAADPGDAELSRCIGPPLRESFARLIANAVPAHIEAAIEAYRERFSTLGWQENRLYPGVASALDALSSAGCTLYVCTSKPEVFATRIISHFGLDDHFVRVYGADLAGALDDKRKLLSKLIEAEALDPAQCVMIGDRHHDMRAARANGTRAIGVLWGYGSREELQEAERLLQAPAELLTLAGPAPRS